MSVWTGATSFPFEHQLTNGHLARHDVYVKGEGQPILILQELPGIGPDTFALADRLIAAGFKVYLPHLLGKLGKASKLTSLTNAVRILCIRHTFQMFRVGAQSDMAAWMRALCAEISDREGGARLGVVGMCLTGSFAIPLMAEDAVHGAVASQPALPVRHSTYLHMSQADVVAANAAMDKKGPALAMRYGTDTLSRPEHITALKAAFGGNLETETFDNPEEGDRSMKHSLLTLDFSEAAYARLEHYFKARFGMG